MPSTRTDDSVFGHGTCVASKATGKFLGVARDIKLYPIKMMWTVSGLIDAFIQLYNFLPDPSITPSVVICPVSARGSFNRKSWSNPPYPWNIIRKYLKLLKSKNVLVVFAAGNHAADSPFSMRSQYTDTYPYLFGEDAALPVIVAGAVTQAGDAAPFSQRLETQPTIYAPGVKVACAARPGPRPVATQTGTSFAAGMV